jgi:hypothetical protein
MSVVVSTLFCVMHFPHNGSIVTIDYLSFDNHHPNPTLAHVPPLYIPSIRVYCVASYSQCLFAFGKEPLQSCLTSRDKVLVIDHVLYPSGARDPLLPPIGLSDLEFPIKSSLTICETLSLGICESSNPYLHDFLDVELPSNKAILKAMILDGGHGKTCVTNCSFFTNQRFAG